MEAFHIPPRYERHFLWMNSARELVVVSYGTLTRPFGGDDPFWTTDIVRSPPPMMWDLYGSGVGADIPTIPELLEMSATLSIPVDHFSSTTAYLFIGLDIHSVGLSSTIPLQMAHSTMVPHATTTPTGNIVVNHAPIGTPCSSRPTPSLPLGYHALNPYVSIHTQIPSEVPLGHNTFAGYVPTPSQVLSGGSYPPLHAGSGPSVSNPIGSTHHLLTSGY